MENVIVFGAGVFGKRYIEQVEDNIRILAVADNYSDKRALGGIKIISPNEIENYNYDKIVICLNDYTNLAAFKAMDDIINQLCEMGIEDDKIELQNVYYPKDDYRVVFLKEYSKSVKKLGLKGAVAECGVMRGHFAHYINKYFERHTFYMFDTFSGFSEKDIKREPQTEIQDFLRERGQLFITHGSEEIAIRRCPNKQNIVVKKGLVPDTFTGLENEHCCFVNLDMDLYAPTLSALCYFAPRMVSGGLILCHDYFNPMFPGIREAVDTFSDEAKAIRLPAGDSMALIMQR